MKIGLQKRGYGTWKNLMSIGEKTGCHQMPERSFFYRGYQFPVCARCTGVFFGYLLAIPAYIYLGYHKVLSVGGCIVMFTDWLAQRVGIKESTNGRRLITGIIGGFGIMSLQIRAVHRIVSKLHYKKK